MCWRTLCVFANDDHRCGHPNKTSRPPSGSWLGHRITVHFSLWSFCMTWNSGRRKKKDQCFRSPNFDKFSIFPHWLISESDDLLFSRHGLILAVFVRILCSLEAITVAVCFSKRYILFHPYCFVCPYLESGGFVWFLCFVVLLFLDTSVYEIVCASTFLKEQLQNRWRTWGAEALKEPLSPTFSR